MNEENQHSIVNNYKFRVIITWLWFIIGGILVFLVFFIIKGFNIQEAMSILNEERHLMVYIEFSSVGLMPLFITLLCKDDLKLYGFNKEKKKVITSLILSLSFVGVIYLIGYLINGRIFTGDIPEYNVEIPWNYIYGIVSIFTWGPLEIFFFIWLVKNTELIFKSDNKKMSKGLIITLILFSLAHIITTDIKNALYMGVIFLILGLIYKYSDNIIGPAIAWTMINGTVWMVSHLFLI